MLINKDVVLNLGDKCYNVLAGSHITIGEGETITEEAVVLLDGQAFLLEKGDKVAIKRSEIHPLIEELGVDTPVDDDDEFDSSRYDVEDDEYDTEDDGRDDDDDDDDHDGPSK